MLCGGPELLVRCLRGVFFSPLLKERHAAMGDWLRAVRAFTNNTVTTAWHDVFTSIV